MRWQYTVSIGYVSATTQKDKPGSGLIREELDRAPVHTSVIAGVKK